MALAGLSRMDFVRDCGAVTTRGRVAWVLVFAGVAMAALGLDARGWAPRVDALKW